MSILVRGPRMRRPRAVAGSVSPSIREVCLIGRASEAPAGVGDRLTWAGRSYDVTATHQAAEGAPRYAHLAAVDEPAA